MRSRSSEIVSPLLALSLLVACGGEASDAPVAPPSAEPPPVAPITDAPTIEGMAIHEWGVIDVPARRGSRAPVALGGVPGRGMPRGSLLDGIQMPDGMAPPPTPTPTPTKQAAPPTTPTKQPPPPRPPVQHGAPRAPLLYVHLPAGHAPVDLTVRVELTGGTIEEHWPLAGERGERVEWVRWQVSARPEACSGSRYPSFGEAPCDNPLRFYCEASELRAYETADAACLTQAGRDFNHLFYRGSVPGVFPLEVSRDPDGTLHVHHAGTDPLPGRIVLLHRNDDPTQTRVRIADAPRPGATIALAPPTDASHDGARAAIYDALGGELGLTPAEVASFRAAWDVSFFGGPRADTEGLRQNAWLPPIDALLYWLPERTITELAPLTIEPHPETLRRALLVRVDLDERPRSYLETSTDGED